MKNILLTYGIYSAVLLFSSFASHPIWANQAVSEMQAPYLNQAAFFFDQSQQLREQGDLHEAERYLRKALDLEPANADYHFELANIYALRHDASKRMSKEPKQSEMLQAAARELEQAVMLDQDLIPAHYNLGVVYKRSGRYEEAREQFKKVLEIDRENAAAFMQIGATYEEQGFFQDAKDYYLKAREMDFHNPAILAAMEDLEENKEKTEDEIRRKEAMDRYLTRQQGVSYNPFGQAAQYEARRQAGLESGQDIRATIPFLSAWLIQEFMKLRGDAEE
ncbi:MAG: tetratricopeptide repeat protein [Candidatus Omnitrophica bacterium]|nr:tetratricopeptide repeat protein [Candidatus Omnitrophota bacterium]